MFDGSELHGSFRLIKAIVIVSRKFYVTGVSIRSPKNLLMIGNRLSRYAFEKYTIAKHVTFDLSGEAKNPWYFTAFGDLKLTAMSDLN
jgi:hypothetical protein